MAVKPTDDFLWAETPGDPSDVVNPTPKRAGGFLPDTDVIAEEFNYLFRAAGRWIQYLNTIDISNLLFGTNGAVALPLDTASVVRLVLSHAASGRFELVADELEAGSRLVADVVSLLNTAATLSSLSVTDGSAGGGLTEAGAFFSRHTPYALCMVRFQAGTSVFEADMSSNVGSVSDFTGGLAEGFQFTVSNEPSNWGSVAPTQGMYCECSIMENNVASPGTLDVVQPAFAIASSLGAASDGTPSFKVEVANKNGDSIPVANIPDGTRFMAKVYAGRAGYYTE